MCVSHKRIGPFYMEGDFLGQVIIKNILKFHLYSRKESFPRLGINRVPSRR